MISLIFIGTKICISSEHHIIVRLKVTVFIHTGVAILSGYFFKSCLLKILSRSRVTAKPFVAVQYAHGWVVTPPRGWIYVSEKYASGEDLGIMNKKFILN